MNQAQENQDMILERKIEWGQLFHKKLMELNTRTWNNGKLKGILNLEEANEVIKRDGRITLCASMEYNVYFITDDSLIVHPEIEQSFNFVSAIFGMPTRMADGTPINTIEELLQNYTNQPVQEKLLLTLDELTSFLANPIVYTPEDE